MSARVTFGNINGHTNPVPHVSLKTEEVFGSEATQAIRTTFTEVRETGDAISLLGLGYLKC